MIYLASPYSHDDPLIMEARWRAVCMAAGRLIAQGKVVFSPIAHSHTVATFRELPRGFSFWMDQDLSLLKACDEVYVLTLPGWMQSPGVLAEIAAAELLQMPVTRIEPSPDELDTIKQAEEARGGEVPHVATEPQPADGRGACGSPSDSTYITATPAQNPTEDTQ